MNQLIQIIKWSQGNPGATAFLKEIMETKNALQTSQMFLKLEEAKSIRGTNLYVLWSDLCQKDLEKVEKLLQNCPLDILENACSRQDYSGRELVSEYL